MNFNLECSRHIKGRGESHFSQRERAYSYKETSYSNSPLSFTCISVTRSQSQVSEYRSLIVDEYWRKDLLRILAPESCVQAAPRIMHIAVCHEVGRCGMGGCYCAKSKNYRNEEQFTAAFLDISFT